MISRLGNTETIIISEEETEEHAPKLLGQPSTPAEVNKYPEAVLMNIASSTNSTKKSEYSAPFSKKQEAQYSSIYDRMKPGRQLNPAEMAELRELKRIDNAVRAHERQHFIAAGAYAMGGPQYHYKIGPDGQRYAYIGHVDMEMSIDLSDPEKALVKAEVIKKAAIAPLDPSPTDMAVAAMAQAAVLRAKAQIQAKKVRQELSDEMQAKFEKKALTARNRLMFCQSFQSRLQSNKPSC